MTKTKAYINEKMYWGIKRPANRFFLAFVWHLPKKVVYWCIIRAATAVEKNEYPGEVTAEQMLKHWSN